VIYLVLGYFVIMAMLLSPLLALAGWIPWLIAQPDTASVRTAFTTYYLFLAWVIWRCIRYTRRRGTKGMKRSPKPN
jgi:hypothetical protein